MIRHNLDSLREIYSRADALLEGWSCEGTTECCRFAITGRTPMLWPNEWALVQAAVAARGGRPARGRRLPVADDGACPLLDRGGRCTIYRDRPFGCRTFYCDRATGPERRLPRAALQELARAVATLAERVEPGIGPRALTSLLARVGR